MAASTIFATPGSCCFHAFVSQPIRRLRPFKSAAGEYVIPELLGGPQAQLVGRVLWQEFFQNGDWPTASAIACTLLLLLLLLPGAIFWAVRVISSPKVASVPSVATEHPPAIQQ